jgi:GMP synthase-like glutamine amidotransferase
MIIIVDNGKGAEEIARFIRTSKQIIKPSEIAKTKASAYILSDGDIKNQKSCIDLIKKCDKPLLAIGAASAFLAAAFGAKPVSGKFEKSVKLKIERPSSLTLDMKKMLSVVCTCQHGIDDLPEQFDVFASSQKYDFEIIGHMESPFFGVHFNPEQGADGFQILTNFIKLVEVWEKYHK